MIWVFYSCGQVDRRINLLEDPKKVETESKKDSISELDALINSILGTVEKVEVNTASRLSFEKKQIDYTNLIVNKKWVLISESSPITGNYKIPDDHYFVKTFNPDGSGFEVSSFNTNKSLPKLDSFNYTLNGDSLYETYKNHNIQTKRIAEIKELTDEKLVYYVKRFDNQRVYKADIKTSIMEDLNQFEEKAKELEYFKRLDEALKSDTPEEILEYIKSETIYSRQELSRVEDYLYENYPTPSSTIGFIPLSVDMKIVSERDARKRIYELIKFNNKTLGGKMLDARTKFDKAYRDKRYFYYKYSILNCDNDKAIFESGIFRNIISMQLNQQINNNIEFKEIGLLGYHIIFEYDCDDGDEITKIQFDFNSISKKFESH